MIHLPSSGGPTRTSPRQAIVVVAQDFQSPGALRTGESSALLADDLRRAVLLDLLGSLVGVNGTSISILSAGQTHAQAIAALIPPGIDVVVPPADAPDPDSSFLWALKSHLHRAFSRVVAVAPDIPALPTRTVATALSSLDSADVVAGPTPRQHLYLLGVRDERGLGIIAAAGATAGFDAITLDAVRSVAAKQEATVRTVERRRRLADVDDLNSIRDAVSASPVSAPRTAALLRTVIVGDAASSFLRAGAPVHNPSL